MGFWAKTEAGCEYGRPSAENGVYVDGPLTAEDLKVLLGYIADAYAEQAKKEALAKAGTENK